MDGFIFWVAIVVIGIWILRSVFRSKAARRPSMGLEDSHKDFKIIIGRESFRGLDCFSVTYKGELNFGMRSGNYRGVIHLLDVTSASGGAPVLCHMPQLQEDDTRVFEYRSDAQEIPPVGNNAKIENAIRIPISSLVLPYSGKRKLRFSAEIKLNVGREQPPRIALDDLDAFATASSEFTYDYEQAGYKEQIDGRIGYEESALRLVVAIARCDGKLDKHEQQIIKEWCREMAMAYDDGVAKRLHIVANEASQEAQDPRQAAIAAARKLRDAPEHEKLAALELCAKVAGADRNTALSESKLLTLVAKEMQANMEHVATIMDKHLPIHASSSSAVESLLGITPNMSAADKKKRLQAEFSKWNRRTASLDPEIKKKAEQMLEYIAAEHQKVN